MPDEPDVDFAVSGEAIALLERIALRRGETISQSLEYALRLTARTVGVDLVAKKRDSEA